VSGVATGPPPAGGGRSGSGGPHGGDPGPGGAVVEPAPAKVNLYLHVLGRRDDGYHRLDSLVAFADIGDGVRVAPTPGEPASLVRTGPFADGLPPRPEEDLCLRAVAAAARVFGRSPEVAVSLDKRLPVASGIGGGSSDAAAVLRGLARLWGDAADDPALLCAAAGLGADVPVCLAARTAFVGGIGERLDPGPDVAGVPLVLANPGRPVPTPAVFKARTGPFQAPARFADARCDAARLAALLAARTNGLADPARAIEPAIDAVVDALSGREGCLLARLSGSGATAFGLFATAPEAQAAAEALATAHPDWWVRAGSLL